MVEKIRETLPSIHWFERIRQIIFFAVGLAFIEIAKPIPFLQSFWGRVFWAGITFFVVKNLIRYRRERSPRFNRKVVRARTRYDKYMFRFTDNARYRIYRMVRIGAILYIAGWVIDTLTAQCNDPMSCVVATPGLIVENFAEILMFMLRLALGMASLFISMFALSKQDTYDIILPHTIKTRFTDVYGQDRAVSSVKEVLGILTDPDSVEAKGGYMPGGILLEGPPGTGKSLLAEAAAGETSKPFVLLGAGSFSNMFVGVPQMKVKALYRKLRKLSLKYGGVVVFFDEIDVLGSRAGVGADFSEEGRRFKDKVVDAMTISSGNGALQMLLSEMSGVQKPRGLYNYIRKVLGFEPIHPPKYRILHMGATNLVRNLDPALLRPGRYDRIIKVDYPDRNGVMETLRGYLDKVPNIVTKEDVALIAANNPGLTGAAIKNTVNEALLKAMREGRSEIEWTDLRDVIIERSLGEELGRVSYVPDRRRVALHEAAHAFAALKWRTHIQVQFASVVRRRNTGGVVQGALKEERLGKTRNELESEILVALASVWAEKFYFDDNLSTGPRSDLQKATAIAKQMWAEYGMGSSLLVCKPDELGPEQIEEVRDYLQELYEILDERMTKYKDVVELFAEELEKEGTVDGVVLQEIYDRLTE